MLDSTLPAQFVPAFVAHHRNIHQGDRPGLRGVDIADYRVLLAKCKTLTLFLLFVLITLFVTSSFSVLNATQAAAASLRETVGASFTLRGNPLEFRTDGTNYAMQLAPISQRDIGLIMGDSEIKAYNAQQSVTATASGFIFPSGMPSGVISANTASAWSRDFTSGILTLAEGRHITGEDQHVALVSRELAEENELQIGGELSFSHPAATVKIIGIYDSAMEQVKQTAPLQWEDYTLQAETAEYDAIAYQLSTIGRLTTLLIVSAITVSIVVLFLILAMRIRGRIHEVGVLLAVGIDKGQIIEQFLIETTVILLLALLVSCPASYFAAMRLGVFLRDMVGAISIDFPAWRLLLQYAVEMLVAAGGVMIAAYPIFQLHPKEILSKMS